jgi:ribokinase
MIDLIAYAPRLPGDGETVVGERFEWGFGGKGANQAVAAARLGAEVAMVNTVGDDDYGGATIANFERQGVDTRFVSRAPGSSGVAPIWVDASGTNRIIVVPGANLRVPADDAVRAVEEVQPAVVVGQFEIPQEVTRAAFVAARRLGATTVLNPAPAAGLDAALLAATDWLVPNETEFASIAGASVVGGGAVTDEDEDAAILELATQAGLGVIVTVGSRGAAVAERGASSTVRIPAPSVATVDTTGAGDAFVGAFAVGLALGWTAEAAATLGCAFASDSTSRPGTQRSFPDPDRAAALLATVAEATRRA